jgi:hypothetical protein
MVLMVVLAEEMSVALGYQAVVKIPVQILVMMEWEVTVPVSLVVFLVPIKRDKGIRQQIVPVVRAMIESVSYPHRHYQLSLPQRPLLLLLLKHYDKPLIFRIISLIFRELHWVNQIPVQPLKDLG